MKDVMTLTDFEKAKAALEKAHIKGAVVVTSKGIMSLDKAIKEGYKIVE